MTTSPWDIWHTHWCCSLVGNSQPAQAGPHRLGRPGPRSPPSLRLIRTCWSLWAMHHHHGFLSVHQLLCNLMWKSGENNSQHCELHWTKESCPAGVRYDAHNRNIQFSLYSPGLILLLLWLPTRKRWREVTNANEKYETYKQSQIIITS